MSEFNSPTVSNSSAAARARAQQLTNEVMRKPETVFFMVAFGLVALAAIGGILAAIGKAQQRQ